MWVKSTMLPYTYSQTRDYYYWSILTFSIVPINCLELSCLKLYFRRGRENIYVAGCIWSSQKVRRKPESTGRDQCTNQAQQLKSNNSHIGWSPRQLKEAKISSPRREIAIEACSSSEIVLEHCLRPCLLVT